MANENIKIEENFLNQGEFHTLQSFMTGGEFPWLFRNKYYAEPTRAEQVSSSATVYNIPDNLRYAGEEQPNDSDFCFVHEFYEGHVPKSPAMQHLDCILKKLLPVAIVKIRANLLTRLPTLVENPFHVDMDDLSEEKQKQWKTSIFYVNTNNGYTLFEDGTKVESVANRMLTFPTNMKHTGTSCTDSQTRIVINFNYYTL